MFSNNVMPNGYYGNEDDENDDNFIENEANQNI